jgi:hypothetical protein
MCNHESFSGPTPAMIEDGDWRAVCNDCFTTFRVALCDYRKTHGQPNAYGQRLPFASGPVISSNSLPFFQPRPDEDFDTYYCGCRGWD